MWKTSHLKGFTATICKVQQPLSSAARFFLQKDALIMKQVISDHVNPILSSNVESISSRGSCILQQPLSPAAEVKLEPVQWNCGHSGKSTTETLAVSMSYKFENSQNSILLLKSSWWGILCLQLLKLGKLVENELTVLNNINCVLLEQEEKTYQYSVQVSLL